jgi:hypothetical protein
MYIGRDPIYGAYDVQALTPDSSTTTFVLDYAVGSAASVMVFYGGVYQIPGVAYSVSGGGTSITFSEAPVTGTTLTLVYLGHQLTIARTAGQETSTESFTGDGTTTNFTLSDPPVINSGIIVFVDGIQQQLTSNFTVSGSTLAFTTAPDSGADIDVYILVKEKVTIDTVSDGTLTRAKMATSLQRNVIGSYSIVDSNTTASSGGYYFVDTSGGAVTLTLPTTALLGDTIRIIDMSGTFDTNNLTVARNSHKIQRDAADLTVDTEGAAFDLIYSNSTNGWLLFSV